MLCERILGNILSENPERVAGKSLDQIDLDWRQCSRRGVRACSRAGLTVGILVPLGQTLRHGDILFEDEESVVAVNVVQSEVLVGEFSNPASLAAAALELGNLHVPVEVAPDMRLVTLPDGPTRGVLERYAADVRVDVQRFAPLRATVLAGSVKLSDSFRVARA
jgi:urease accessory protein